MNKKELVQEIERLKKEKNAIILAHYYSCEDVQDVADFIGDSLELSRKAGNTQAKVIVFAGVHFMAETAAVISPDKKVLIPALGAGCSLADSVCAQDLQQWKSKNKDGIVVSYVNTTAQVKSFTDICCTSANAVKVVESLPKDAKILFVPDENLGSYIINQTKRQMELHPGCCKVHQQITSKMILDKLAEYPNADVLIHPEAPCSSDPAILNNPRCFLYSTSGILRHVNESDKKQFIIATEIGTLHKLKQNNKDKELIPVSQNIVCNYMKLATLEKVYEALRDEKYQVKLEASLAKKALNPIAEMMKL